MSPLKKFAKRILAVLFIVLIGFLAISCNSNQATHNENELAELTAGFKQAELDLLETWYPRVVDEEDGGYLTDFNASWELDGPQRKMIVTQARHVWTASQAALRYPENTAYLNIARHGYRFLKDFMWDHTNGGFYTLVTKQGEPILEDSYVLKTAYGNAFGIYGLAAYARASQDPEALDFAKEAFRWLDKHSHDSEYGGYFQFLEQTGAPRAEGYNQIPPKDQNSSIHLLEAFTELYGVWENEEVGSRLAEMLSLIRDTMVLDHKYLQLFFYKDWQPLSFRDSTAAIREANYNRDHVSVGHDIETSFLMLEAAHALHIPDKETREAGKSMVDHALKVGWDNEVGGFYDYVYYLPGDDHASVVIDTKNWWAQAEGLNALLLMYTLYPDDPNDYFDKFKLQWSFTNKYLIDHERGGWYTGSLDKQPNSINSAKSQIWKSSYHTVRSLMHCVDMLEKIQS